MASQTKETRNPKYKYASIREKYCFGIGAIGKDAICNLVGAFLMLYLTDTLYLAPAFVGGLFFVARIWDAVNDPMMGMVVDNTHTKYGKFRIWITIGTLVNSVVFILLFHSFNLKGTALYVYVSIMYILYGMTYTIMDVPYWSWLPNLTNDPREREKVSVIPRFFASLAGFSVSTFGLYIIHYFNRVTGEDNLYAEKGYTIFAIIIVIVFIVTIGITVLNVKEESTLGTSSEKTSLKQAFNVIIKNDQLLNVLDYSRPEVVDHIYGMMAKLLSESKISYIKWDMNRSITECYSAAFPADQQGEVSHRYILGVYNLYERLTSAFPHVLFESCASGGGRFDPGLLYYAPQGWASDDSDAVERLKIQYGTSMCYPVSSIGSHVSVTPNHQVFRNTPLHTRANVAYFGTFGYELDLNKLSPTEIEEVKEQIIFMKEYRNLLQFGTFYRLKSPFEGNETIWMVVSDDKKTALVGYYRVLNGVNVPYSRVQLQGLDSDLLYINMLNGMEHYGDELMNLGLITSDVTAGEVPGDAVPCTDFESRIYILKAKEHFNE